MGWIRDLLLGTDDGVTPRYGRAQEDPDPIDWAVTEATLVEAGERSIAAFAEKHKRESFYGLGFDCNSSEGQVLICLNTRERQRAAANQVFRPYNSFPSSEGDRLASGEWGFGEWAYHGVNLRQRAWSRSWKDVEDRVAGSFFMLATNRRHEAIEALRCSFMLMASKSLLRIAAGAAVSSLRRDSDFQVLCMDHDESLEAAFQRLAELRSGAL